MNGVLTDRAGHTWRYRRGQRPVHIAGCRCWSGEWAVPPLTVAAAELPAAPPALPARRSWVARVLLAAGLVEEVPRAER